MGYFSTALGTFDSHKERTAGIPPATLRCTATRRGPLVRPTRLLGRVEMTNLIGAEVNEAAGLLTVPGACLHLYGKKDARPGRKMGHVTRVFPS